MFIYRWYDIVVMVRNDIMQGENLDKSEWVQYLVGKNSYTVKNSAQFVTNLQGVCISPNDQLVSFNVVSLFTQVPIDHALKVVERRLSDDRTLIERTTIPVQQLVQLTELCLFSTYFKYQSKFYEQTDGAAMGSLVSPNIANLFMEQFE